MKKFFIPILLAALILLSIGSLFALRDEENLYSSIRLVGRIITETYTKYVDDFDLQKAIEAGISGMLSTLDPHTVYFEEKQYEDLKVDTRGKFEGLGIVIGIRDNVLTVISPIEGTPAYRMGVRAGDQIVKIEGKSTRGIIIEQAVKKLRGPRGTKVTISIRRPGEPKLLDYTITRDVIEIKSVPFYGMIDDEIGYIRLTRFSQDASTEVAEALKSLKEEGMKSLIFDLRSNPGGLLRQAVEVAGLFLPENSLIVSTRGRKSYHSQDFRSFAPPEFDEGKLVVLVNPGSASASEIVAGAIQDNDRGLTLGQETFGKGLVQSVIDLGNNTALKITTAKYYIPSGRCIQKENYLKRKETAIYSRYYTGEEEEKLPEEEEETEEDTTRELFYTLGGRVVYGGGGITPDVKVEQQKLNRLEIELERKSMFFGFAIEYTKTHKELSPDFEVTDEMLDEFKEYLTRSEFEFKTRPQEELENLKKILDESDVDSSAYESLIPFEKILENEKEEEFGESIDYIKHSIKREIVSALWGEKERYRQTVLKYDPDIKKAVEILGTPGEYEKYFALTEK
ncbi:MAG: hypothetical protein B6D65_01545 [candidate division Zixibacteria bacterium 4484_93]|nr:MAG: hypothetical protein B6D65_01545 [candidate division Zixibacteria bacterium 4484_93]